MRIILILVLGLTVPVSCAGDGPSAVDGVDVVASFAPLAEVARAVGGDRVTVADLAPADVEPHDLELDSRRVERIADADVVVVMGEGFQPAVEDLVADRDDSVLVVLEELRGLRRDGGAVDPHVWLDPTRVAEIAGHVATALGEADPAGRAEYADGATALRGRLARLDRELRVGLATCRSRVLVTAHDAFAYLADRYDLRAEPVAGISPEAEPDPSRLAELADLVRREAVTTVFTEERVPHELARTLAREAGVQTGVLDPVELLPPGRTYAEAMRANLRSLRAGLGCT